MEALCALLPANYTTAWKEDLLQGHFQELLSCDCFHAWTLQQVIDHDNLEVWNAHVTDTLAEGSDEKLTLEAVVAGVSCLCLFMQSNWTGPALEWQCEDISHFGNETLNTLCAKELASDGEFIYGLAKFPALLYVAKKILVDNRTAVLNVKAAPLWSLRCLQVYQTVLGDPSMTLLSLFNLITKEAEAANIYACLPSSLIGQFHLELAHLHLQYYESDAAEERLSKAQEGLGITVSLSAALGKRTKFQQTELPQLLLEVELTSTSSENNASDVESDVLDSLPQDVGLDNDTLLPTVAFTDSKDVPVLSALQQAFVVASCVCRQKRNARDNLLEEELSAYVECVLRQPVDWSVQSMALLTRSRIERVKSRKVERAMMQLENLIADRQNEKPGVVQRLAMAWSVALPPIWSVERSLGQVLMSLGCVKTALDVYLRIHSWEDIIHCYHSLGRREKAENVIKEQLAIEETPKLWCLLGDVTDDCEFYVKAWDVSGQRSSRAQRCLGLWHLRRKKFEECIPYLTKSLQLNSLQPTIWFSLGCSHMLTGTLEPGVKAFQRCVTQDPDNSEAWSNLGSVLLRLDRRQQGFKALQEAVKLNRDNWKMWQNYLLVSVDLGEIGEAMVSFHRLLELKPKEIDVQALGSMVRQVDERLSDSELGTGTARSVVPKVMQLFGKITSQITSNCAVWRLYAHLFLMDIEQRDTKKAFHYLIKAQNCAVQHTDWRHDLGAARDVIDVSNQLLEVADLVAAAEMDSSRKLQLMSSPLSAVANFLLHAETASIADEKDEETGRLGEDLNALRNRVDTAKSQLTAGTT